MPKRLLLIFSLAVLPLAAFADDTPPAGDAPAANAALAPEATAAPASTTAPSTGLGPDSSAGAGSSTAASGSLQPAGTSPLQSTANDSAGLTAPANALQAPAASNAELQVLAGEGDGAQHELAEDTNTSMGIINWLVTTLILAALFAAAIMAWRKRRNFSLSKRSGTKIPAAQSSAKPDEEPQQLPAGETEPPTDEPDHPAKPEAAPTGHTPRKSSSYRHKKRKKQP